MKKKEFAESLKEKTVLMLTHDIDPIIDMFKVLYVCHRLVI